MVQARYIVEYNQQYYFVAIVIHYYNLKEKFYPLWISCVSKVTYQFSNDFFIPVQKELPEQAPF